MKKMILTIAMLACVGGCTASTAATAITVLAGIDWTGFATAIKTIVVSVQ